MGMYGAAALSVLRDIRNSANKRAKPMSFEGKIIAFVLLVVVISVIGVCLVSLAKEAAYDKQKKEAAKKAQATEEKRSAAPVMSVSLSDKYEITLPGDAELMSEEKKNGKTTRRYSFKDKFSVYGDYEEIDKVYKCEFSLTAVTGKTDEDLESAVYDKYAGRNGNLRETDINGDDMFIFEGTGKDGYWWKDSSGTMYALELSGKYFHEYQDVFLRMISEK